MTLTKRLDRLEALRGSEGSAGPSIIFLCGPDGKAQSGLLLPGGTLSRNDFETEAEFCMRAEIIQKEAEKI